MNEAMSKKQPTCHMNQFKLHEQNNDSYSRWFGKNKKSGIALFRVKYHLKSKEDTKVKILSQPGYNAHFTTKSKFIFLSSKLKFVSLFPNYHFSPILVWLLVKLSFVKGKCALRRRVKILSSTNIVKSVKAVPDDLIIQIPRPSKNQ